MSSEHITSVFNDGYIAEAYEAFQRDPSSVDESWRQFFRFAQRLTGVTAPAGGVDASLLEKVEGVINGRSRGVGCLKRNRLVRCPC